MIARIPQIVSRYIASALIASTLAFGTATLAAPFNFNFDPATTYAQIQVDINGSVINPYDSDNNSALVNVPTSILGSQRPSVTADGSLDLNMLSIASVNGNPGFEFVIKSAKLVQDANDSQQIQLEIGVVDQGAEIGSHPVQLILENMTTGATMPVGVLVNVQ
jgi:hypothetical protein